MRVPSTFIVALACLALSACAVNWDEEYQALAQAPVCCKSMAEFSFEPVELGRRFELDIDEHSSAFDFSGEKSFFRAFEIPPSDKRLRISVEANMPWKGFPRTYAMFHPAVQFLDERKEPVFQLPASAAGYVQYDLFNADRLLTSQFVDPRDGWRYFVVYTESETYKSPQGAPILRAFREAGGVSAGRGVFIPLYQPAMGDTAPHPGAPTARIKVTIDQAPAGK